MDNDEIKTVLQELIEAAEYMQLEARRHDPVRSRRAAQKLSSPIDRAKKLLAEMDE